jgi:arginine/lysine/ornithine decarboxylase
LALGPARLNAVTIAATRLVAVVSTSNRRLGWLVEISRNASEAAMQASRVIDSDDHDPEQVLRLCGAFLSELVSQLDNSGSNPDLDGLTGGAFGPVSWLNLRLADLYGARSARVVVSGSSGANLIGVGLLLPQVCGPARKVLCDRHCHLSVVGGLVVSGSDVVWLHREYLAEHDVAVPVSASVVQTMLDNDPLIGAVVLTSPTYDGFDIDIEAIAAACRGRGVMLVIDGAWGAGYGALSAVGFPPSPVQLGADLAVTSSHKKGFAPSGVAVALFRDADHADLFDAGGNLGFSTTSPSYFLLASAESQIADLINGDLAEPWARAVAVAEDLAAQLPKAHPAFRRVRLAEVGAVSGDPCHILVHVAGAGITGYQLQKALEPLGIIAEKATRDTLLLLVGPAAPHRAEDWIAAMREAVRGIDRAPSVAPAERALVRPNIRSQAAMSVREAFMKPSRLVPLSEAAGLICAQLVAVYPPGSAVLAPGEEIQVEHLEYLDAVALQGGRIRGLHMPGAGIRVVISDPAT